jgi:hypothetical protein
MSIHIGISKLRGGPHYYALAAYSIVIYSRRCETVKEREAAVWEMEQILKKWR